MTESLNRILVPIDFSAHSEKAIRYATTLANKFGARLSLLHVIEDPFVTGAWQAEVFVPNIPELLNDLIKAAKAQLAERKKDLAAHGFIIETAVITGRPATAIVEQASTGRFDVIVMGTHGRTGLTHALLGSVAERVVQKAPCPVLTVREAAPASPKAEISGNRRCSVIPSAVPKAGLKTRLSGSSRRLARLSSLRAGARQRVRHDVDDHVRVDVPQEQIAIDESILDAIGQRR